MTDEELLALCEKVITWRNVNTFSSATSREESALWTASGVERIKQLIEEKQALTQALGVREEDLWKEHEHVAFLLTRAEKAEAQLNSAMKHGINNAVDGAVAKVELELRAEKAEARLAEAEQLLKGLNRKRTFLCGHIMGCQEKWVTSDGQKHGELCMAIKAFLANGEGE